MSGIKLIENDYNKFFGYWKVSVRKKKGNTVSYYVAYEKICHTSVSMLGGRKKSVVNFTKRLIGYETYVSPLYVLDKDKHNHKEDVLKFLAQKENERMLEFL